MLSNQIRKIISFLLCFCLLFQQSGFPQAIGTLNLSGYFSSIQGNSSDTFRPLHLRYLSYNPAENNFRLLVDKGDFKPVMNDKELESWKARKLDKRSSQTATDNSFQLSSQNATNNSFQPSNILLESETKKLLQYFFIGLSLPNDVFWVNLRPDIEEGSRGQGAQGPSASEIIDDDLAKTDIGRIMLETDVQLKKDTAQFTSPQTPKGKQYWDKLYKKAEELFGSENVNIPTLTRPWIVPNEIIIRETQDSAYIYKATLKVMLEEDYIKSQSHQDTKSQSYNFNDPRLKELNIYASELMRELIIPKLTREINSSKRYAELRQVYYSLILAQWFKARFSSSSLRGAAEGGDEAIYNLINSRNLTNLTSKDPWTKAAYFKEYQKSFQQGEYNIKEPRSTAYGQSIRSYFSGGIVINIVVPNQVGKIPELNPNVLLVPSNGLPERLASQINLKSIEAQGTSRTEEFIIPANRDQDNLKKRAQAVIGRPILNTELIALQQAHGIGQGHYLGTQNPDGAFNKHIDPTLAYTSEEIALKARILKAAGFTEKERRNLIKYGVVGNIWRRIAQYKLGRAVAKAKGHNERYDILEKRLEKHVYEEDIYALLLDEDSLVRYIALKNIMDINIESPIRGGNEFFTIERALRGLYAVAYFKEGQLPQG